MKRLIITLVAFCGIGAATPTEAQTFWFRSRPSYLRYYWQYQYQTSADGWTRLAPTQSLFGGETNTRYRITPQDVARLRQMAADVDEIKARLQLLAALEARIAALEAAGQQPPQP